MNGRQIKIEHHDCDIFTPDGIQAGYRAVVDTKPDAIGSAFVPLARQTMLEALGDYKAPLLTGDTNFDLLTFAKKNRDKYWNYFQVDPPEIYYGRMFPKFLDQVAAVLRQHHATADALEQRHPGLPFEPLDLL